MFVFRRACTYICVNARVSLLLLLFLFAFLCLFYVKGLSESFTNPPSPSLYFIHFLLHFGHPPPSFLPSPYPSSLPKDSVRLSSHQFLLLPHSTLHPLIILLPTHVTPNNTSPPHIYPAHPYNLPHIKEHVQIPSSFKLLKRQRQWKIEKRREMEVAY
jgi:hypothetical protein